MMLKVVHVCTNTRSSSSSKVKVAPPHLHETGESSRGGVVSPVGLVYLPVPYRTTFCMAF